MNIESLPDDCLLAILNKLPLYVALSNREVNGRWNRLVLTMCRGRKHLFLFGSFRGLVDYAKHLNRVSANSSWNLVKPSEIGQFSLIINRNRLVEHVVQQLKTFFPNIANLIFFYFNWPNGEMLQLLLAQYKQNLVSLTVHGMPPNDDQQRQAWQAINEVPKLSQFHMFAANKLIIPFMPFVARLEHLTLVNYFNNVAGLLGQLGPQLKTLILDNVHLSKDILELAIQQAPHLTTSLENLFVGNVACPKKNFLVQAVEVVDMDRRVVQFQEIQLAQAEWLFAKAGNPKKVLDYICSHFQRLKRVDVAFMPWSSARESSFGQIIEQLTKLEQLQSVHLTMTANDVVSQKKLLPLPLVKDIKLDIVPFAREHLKHVLPLVFCPATKLEIECIDASTLKNLAKFFSCNNWSKVKLSQGLNFRTFFSNMGYGDEYTAYLNENLGPLVHMF